MKKVFDYLPNVLTVIAVITGCYLAVVKVSHSRWVDAYNEALAARAEVKAHVTEGLTKDQADLAWSMHGEMANASSQDELDLLEQEARLVLEKMGVDGQGMVKRFQAYRVSRVTCYILAANAQEEAQAIFERPLHPLLLKILGEETPHEPYM